MQTKLIKQFKIMKFERDLFLDILYSVLLSFVMLIDSSYIQSEFQEYLIMIFKNIIILALLGVFLKSLMNIKKDSIILINSFTREKSVIYNGFSLIRSFIDFKLVIFLIIFLVSVFIFEEVTIGQLPMYIIQLISICLYTLSVLLITISFVKANVNIVTPILLLSPYLVIFLLFEIFDLNNFLYFTIIPSNINMFFSFSFEFLTNNFVILVFSIISFLIMFTGIFVSVKKMMYIYA